MLQGYPLAVTLPEDSDLGERFWYWRGASGRSYIHSIYHRELCPVVPGAVFVIVSVEGGSRRATSAGRFSSNAGANTAALVAAPEEEIHVHLLARDELGASLVLRDLLTAMDSVLQSRIELRVHAKPVQLDLLAA